MFESKHMHLLMYFYSQFTTLSLTALPSMLTFNNSSDLQTSVFLSGRIRGAWRRGGTVVVLRGDLLSFPLHVH